MVEPITLREGECWVCGQSKEILDESGVELSEYIVGPPRQMGNELPLKTYKVFGCEICYQLLGRLHGISP